MKILYISKLDGEEWQGPTHSVPKQISAQSKVDTVLWVNLNSVSKPEWEKTGYYINAEKKKIDKLAALPPEFQKPDCVVFEGIYEYPFESIVYDIWRKRIPYVIVPRSAMTVDALQRKKLKKAIANILFFNRFVKKASRIHYLTQVEYEASNSVWNHEGFVIPNGVDASIFEQQADKSRHDGIVVTYIGRLEIYQKGLDLLVESCGRIAEKLRANNIHIRLYGPDRENTLEELRRQIAIKKVDDIISIYPPVFDKEKVKVLLDSDVFLMTSRFEGMSMGMIEAMAYGLPCLATKGTNLTTEIVNFAAGWTADNTAESIVDAFNRMIDDQKMMEKFGNNAKVLSKQYEWSNIAIQTHKELSHL